MSDQDDDSSNWGRQAGQARRAQNRGYAPVALREAGIAFEMRNDGAHLIVDHGRIDFWPGTGLWHVRGGAQGRGIKKLIKLVKTRPGTSRTVICDYCAKPARLVKGDVIYPGTQREDLRALRFWHCAPCRAWVGCHPPMTPRQGGIGDGTVPLGRLANAQLRRARSAVHAVFDPLWDNGEPLFSQRRGRAYRWLAQAMGIPVAHCHVGMFDLDQCAEAARLCKEKASDYHRHTAGGDRVGEARHPQLQQPHGAQAYESPQPEGLDAQRAHVGLEVGGAGNAHAQP